MLLLACISASSGAMWGCEGGGTAARKTPTTTTTIVRLMTGPHGGGFVPMGERVGEAVRAGMPGIRLEAIASSGAVDNATAVQKGEADLGLTFADVAYTAYTGRLRKRDRPFQPHPRCCRSPSHSRLAGADQPCRSVAWWGCVDAALPWGCPVAAPRSPHG